MPYRRRFLGLTVSCILASVLFCSCGGLEPGPVDVDAPEEFTKTSSGLRYRIRRKSDGPIPTEISTVVVHYRGWLKDGTVFDSSYRRGEPLTTPMNRVVPGWREGLPLIGEGGMIELKVPAELGYGTKGKGKVPPFATLYFLVELIEVK